MNLAVAMAAWLAAGGVVFFGPFRDARVPLLVFLIAYGASTMVGAAFMLDPMGQAELRKLHPSFDQDMLDTLGATYYWTFLLMPLALVPVGALVGERIGAAVMVGPIRSAIVNAEAPRWLLFLMLVVLTAYCGYRLVSIGAAMPGIIDSSLCYGERIERRTELIALLGTSFYSIIYSALPVIGAVFLADYLQSRRRLALVGFAVCMLVLLWLYSTIYMKYPFVMLALLVLMTLYFSGIGLVRATLIVAPVAAFAFVALSAIEVCVTIVEPAVRTVEKDVPKKDVARPRPGFPGVPSMGAPAREKSRPPVEEPTYRQESTFSGHFSHLATAIELMERIARNLTFRMAIGFPYYLAIFSDEREYCGTSSRFLPFGPKPSQCEPEIKVFQVVYPNVTNVVGYQPAPVNVISLAQGGPLFAVIATILVGLMIGGLAAIAAARRTPLLIAASGAVCVYAYYASQASLRGAVLHSYGLLWCLLTLAAIFVVSLIVHWRRAPPGAG